MNIKKGIREIATNVWNVVELENVYLKTLIFAWASFGVVCMLGFIYNAL